MIRRPNRTGKPVLVFALAVTLAGMAALTTPAAPARDEPPTTETSESEFPMPELTDHQKAMYEEAMRIAGPGPEHEILRRLEGSWDLTVVIRPSPGAEPMKSVGTSEARMILGGRFLEVRTHSDDGPMTSEGLTLLGFDRRYGHYTQTSYDTWATYYVTGEGGWNEAKDALILSGTDHDPVMGVTQEYDFVYRFPDENTWVSEVVFKGEAHTQGKGPHKMVEVTGRRRGGRR